MQAARSEERPLDATTISNLQRLMEYEASRTAKPVGFPHLPDLPGGRYTAPRFYQLEQEHLWRLSWLLASHLDELPEPGCFRLWDLAGQPMILVHGDDGKIRAFYNTCSHRGAPFVIEPSGKAPRLVCAFSPRVARAGRGRVEGVPVRPLALDGSARLRSRVQLEDRDGGQHRGLPRAGDPSEDSRADPRRSTIRAGLWLRERERALRQPLGVPTAIRALPRPTRRLDVASEASGTWRCSHGMTQRQPAHAAASSPAGSTPSATRAGCTCANHSVGAAWSRA